MCRKAHLHHFFTTIESMPSSCSDIYVDLETTTTMTTASATTTIITTSTTTTTTTTCACPKPRCKICVWRNIILPEPEDTGDEIVSECHTPLQLLHLSTDRSETNKRMMSASHKELPPLWKTICNTGKLQAGNRSELPNDSRLWFKFPLRGMRPMSLRPSFHLQTQTAYVDSYEGQRIHSDADGKFTMYHMAKLLSLVQMDDRADSGGILIDGGMRYGCKHGDGIGVYCCASEPCDCFKEGDGWVMLELRCHAYLTRVKKGSRGRYLIKSDQTPSSASTHCIDCEVVSIYHLYESLPDFMK